jgi:Na+-translocating ferredoxin:NAD+ oxidoreductase RnfD subunit
MTAVAIRGESYPVILPKLRDPRLHLAATITSLQVLGQVAFHFRLSIAQILLSLATAGLLDAAITFRRKRVLMWPASALLTGNGVAFVLRVPGTRHGDWWSLHGWWLYVAVAGGALLSKHVLRWRGEHVFNPSNIGLVVCFLALGRTRAEPLDFWWGPMSWWMGAALAIIVAGGLAILSRLHLLRVAVSFWIAFAASIALLAWRGHAMTARWHLGPISGFHFWWVLVTSPEVLVFLFFMITDPRTAPAGLRARVVYGLALGVLAGALIAPTTSEFAAKVALLSTLAIVCVAQVVLRHVPRRALALAAAPALVGAVLAIVLASPPAPPALASARVSAGSLPAITILPSPGVQTQLDRRTAAGIAQALVAAGRATSADHVAIHLVPGSDQGPPTAVAALDGRTFSLTPVPVSATWKLQGAPAKAPARVAVRTSPTLVGLRLRNVAPQLGLDFRQGSFRFGMSNDYEAMMGGGVCFLDWNGDGWQDLFVVNAWSDADLPSWESHGGAPRAALYENVHGRFRDVSKQAHADLAVKGQGCAAADLNGDGRTDLVVTSAQGAYVLWNRADGTFRTTRLPTDDAWYTGAAIADVNGDGRPDVFLAGYTSLSDAIPTSLAGFPSDYGAVRDVLLLNEGGRFREVGVAAGLESAAFSHGLGAVFVNANGDGRPDLYVANDEDPNELYVNVPWPGGARVDPAGLGFRFENRAAPDGVADPYAGMGVAAGKYLFVTNSRREPSAAYRPEGSRFVGARAAFLPALGTGFAGWGVSWVDLANTGSPDLVLAAGAIPVTRLAADAEPVRVLTPLARGGGFGDATTRVLPGGLLANGRGLAAADIGNDGRVALALNTVGGKLALLRSSGRVGHWLEVATSPLSPGATITAVLPGGKRLVGEVEAGSSYLSSEDPRVHLGLGAATVVPRLVVRFPFGGTAVLLNVRADRVVTVPRPPPQPAPTTTSVPCTAPGASVAEAWDRTAIDVLRRGGASQPVQARTLFRLSSAMLDAYRAGGTQAARAEAISYAAYRVLLWDASFDANLQSTFGTLVARLRSFCLSPDVVATTGSSPAAIGNRIAASIIASGRDDGSLEAQHFVDASYTPQNDPLVVAQPGSTVHDATFWQPLALSEKKAQGLAAVPADVQRFADAQWGRMRPFAPSPADVGGPPFGLPSSTAYKDAALAAIRATANAARSVPDASPLAWNELANTLARPADRLRYDVRLYFALDAALHDAAIAAWRAKRTYQAPRPISMVRYLAFQGQSTDEHARSYSRDGLPLVRGLTELSRDGQVLVRERGRWIAGAGWTPPAATPASPGWVSEESTFASAASAVLRSVAHRSFARTAAALGNAGVERGIETPADAAAGRRLGAEVGARVLARVSSVFR